MNFRNMKIKVENNLNEIVGELERLVYKKTGWIGYKNPSFITTNTKGFYTDHGVEFWLMFGNDTTLAELKDMKK